MKRVLKLQDLTMVFHPWIQEIANLGDTKVLKIAKIKVNVIRGVRRMQGLDFVELLRILRNTARKALEAMGIPCVKLQNVPTVSSLRVQNAVTNEPARITLILTTARQVPTKVLSGVPNVLVRRARCEWP